MNYPVFSPTGAGRCCIITVLTSSSPCLLLAAHQRVGGNRKLSKISSQNIIYNVQYTWHYEIKGFRQHTEKDCMIAKVEQKHINLNAPVKI